MELATRARRSGATIERRTTSTGARPSLLSLLLSLLFVGTLGCQQEQSPLLVFGAVSASEVLTELGREFERVHGEPVQFSFGASSQLARQIGAGAPADLFVSADEAQAHSLRDTGELRAPIHAVASNRLVVITAKRDAANLDPRELGMFASIGIADPQSVPAGVYAKGWLQRAGIFDEISKKLIPLMDVRAVVAAVKSKTVDIGIVYRSDALRSPDLRVLYEVPSAQSPEILHVAARVTGSSHPRADDLLQAITSHAALHVWRAHGFLPPTSSPHAAEPTAHTIVTDWPRDLRVVVFTFATALLTTVLLLPFGIALGFLLSRSSRTVKTWAQPLLSVPMVLPPTAVGWLLLRALSPTHAFGEWLDEVGIEVLFSWPAVVLGGAVMSAPLLVRFVQSAFEDADPRLFSLGRTLGRSPLQVFVQVAIPVAWRGITAGALLAFARALGEFGATILIAGNIPGRTQTMSLAIFQRVQTGDDAGAFRMALLSVVIATFVLVSAAFVLSARSEQSQRGS